MNEFPLSPFLDELIADGFYITLHDYKRISLVLQNGTPWTIEELHDVLLALLVRDKNQQNSFSHRFYKFFRLDPAAENRFTNINIDKALKDLSLLEKKKAYVPLGPKKHNKRRPSIDRDLNKPLPDSDSRSSRRRMIFILSAIIISVATLLTYSFLLSRSSFINPPQPQQADPGMQSTPSPDTNRINLAQLIGLITGIPVLILIVAALAYKLIKLYSKLRQGKSLTWDPDAQRLFPLDIIGGKQAQQLDSTFLDYISDSLSYFKSEQPSSLLNLSATVDATIKNAGLLTLVQHTRKHLRTVIVLEDTLAEPLAWNSVSKELAVGLSLRGVPVIYGFFSGSPIQFQTNDETNYWLEDLEDDRGNFLMMIFSDGKGIQNGRDGVLLKSLAKWPMAAWMELREPRFWDESTLLIADYGLAIYPATQQGIKEVINRFSTERGAKESSFKNSDSWKGVPANTSNDLLGLSIYIEHLLGDAIRWGQACAMIQPVSFGLADALRREFAPGLPPSYLERLIMLPGTSRSVSGIKFSAPVLAVLRSGFRIRWEEKQQEEILKFIIKEIEKFEPGQSNSLAHIAWEWALERVRLELDPDKALKRITQLAQTPLSPSIRVALGNLGLEDPRVANEGAIRIPLRLKPKSKKALQQLERFAISVNNEAGTDRIPGWMKFVATKGIYATPLLFFIMVYIPSPIYDPVSIALVIVIAGLLCFILIVFFLYMGRKDKNINVHETHSEGQKSRSVSSLNIVPEKYVIKAGESVLLKAALQDQDMSSISFEWKTSLGRIEGTGPIVTLHMANDLKEHLPTDVEIRLEAEIEGGDAAISRIILNVMPSGMSSAIDKDGILSKADLYYLRANWLYLCERYYSAMEECKEGLKIDPLNKELKMLLEDIIEATARLNDIEG